jgi:hypothetical protein
LTGTVDVLRATRAASWCKLQRRGTSAATGEKNSVGALFGAPHTGKSFRIMAIDIQTIRDGRISETYHLENWLSALGQLRAQLGPSSTSRRWLAEERESNHTKECSGCVESRRRIDPSVRQEQHFCNGRGACLLVAASNVELCA